MTNTRIALTGRSSFVTNSSSQIVSFSKELLDNPQVKAFLEAFDIVGGYVGSNLWDRGQCGSLIVTDDQTKEANDQLQDPYYTEYATAPTVELPSTTNKVTAIYGDEYSDDMAYQLVELIGKVTGERIYGWDYN